MPDTGTPYFLPFPTLSDVTDANKYLKQLADAQHAARTMLVPRSSRYKTVSQSSLPANVWTLLTFETEEALPQGSVPIPYNAGVWTIQRAGVYQINAAAHFQFSAGVQCRLAIAVTGVSYLTHSVVGAPPNSSGNATKAWRFIVGDTFSIMGFSLSAGSTAYGSTTRYTYADISWIAS